MADEKKRIEQAFLKAVRGVQKARNMAMDPNNEGAMKIGESQGMDAMVAHMTKGRTYAEMRSLFG